VRETRTVKVSIGFLSILHEAESFVLALNAKKKAAPFGTAV
jgi:hypothetical protein